MRTRLAAVAVLLALVAGCGPPAAPDADPDPDGTSAAGWTRLPDPPLSGRTGATVVALADHRVLVVGGWEWLCPPNADCALPDQPMLRDAAVLDTATARWRTVAEAPFGLIHAEGAVLGDDAYLLSGCRSGPGCDGRPELVRYDVDRDVWEELGPAPRDLRYAHLAAAGGRLVAFQDSDEHGERADHVLDPSSGRWTRLPDDPLPAAYDRRVVVDGDRLLLFGSTLDDGGEPDVKIGAALDLTTMRWTRLPDAPGSGYQVWRVGDEAWLNPHYGEGGGVLDLPTDTWRALPDPPAPELDLAGVLGRGEATYEYAAGWVRDTRHDRWLEIPDRPGEVYDESLTAVADALLVFGGQQWEGSDGELVAEAWLWCPPG